MDQNTKDTLRSYIETHGMPAVIDPDATEPEYEVSEYGWVDYNPLVHASDPALVHKGEGCRWVLAENVTVVERTYDLFDGPGRSKVEEGFNATFADCACGKYTGVTLRTTEPLGELLVRVLSHGSGTITF